MGYQIYNRELKTILLKKYCKEPSGNKFMESFSRKKKFIEELYLRILRRHFQDPIGYDKGFLRIFLCFLCLLAKYKKTF